MRQRSPASTSLPFVFFHLSLAPLSVILRMVLGMNKYLVIAIVSGSKCCIWFPATSWRSLRHLLTCKPGTGCMLLLVQWADGKPFGSQILPMQGGLSLDASILGQGSTTVH